MRNVQVAARVAELWKEKFSRASIDGDSILRELASIAFGHPGFFVAHPGGLRVYEKLDALKTLAKLRGLADEGVSDEERAKSIRGHLAELDKATFVDPPEGDG